MLQWQYSKVKDLLPKNTTMNSNKKVFFYPEKYVPPMKSNSSINLDKITLKAGENDVTPDELKFLQQHPDFIFWLRQGAFAVGAEPVPTPEPIPTPTPVPVPTPEPELTPIPTPTPTPEVNPMPEPTPNPNPKVQTITLTVANDEEILIRIVPNIIVPEPILTAEITDEMIISKGRQLGLIPQEKTAPEVDSEVEFSTHREMLLDEAPADNLLAEADRPISGVSIIPPIGTATPKKK